MNRRRLFQIVAVMALVAAGAWWWNRRQPVPPTEIYQGITYGCERLESSAEGSGLVHWVRVDLAAPGIELYVTPLDPEAVNQGWQYRLRRTGTVVQKEHLAVAVNGTLFVSDSGWLPITGDLARAQETTVADHRVSRGGDHTLLLWFDDDLTPHVETTRGPAESVLNRARWGIGGESAWLVDGKIEEWAEKNERGPLDARTTVGINQKERLLFLAVFENVSPRRAMEKLAQLGAMDGIMLDSGDSTCMALGKNARGVRPGVLLQGWRPVATHFGIRAKALPRH